MISSIYFGGGTPTELESEGLALILEWIRDSCSLDKECEITVEANPENISQPLIRALIKAGVNRMSLGIQSLDENHLKTLGRNHSSVKAEEAIHICSQEGMVNLSIDLMYDVPSQTLSSFQKTLAKIPSLPITHLSLYNLTIEPNTAYGRKKNELLPLLPSDAESTSMLQTAIDTLNATGLKRYEISAFAYPGFESRHNLGYWQGKEFLGLGPSAFSYINEERFQNAANLKQYQNALSQETLPISFSEKLPYPKNLQERLAIALRVLSGVDLSRFPPLPKELQKTIHRLQDNQLLCFTPPIIKLTEKGKLFYDSVAIELI